MRTRDRGPTPRVVLLVENLPVPLDRRVWQEARALRDDGWAVTVIGPRGQGPMRPLHERTDGIEILRFPQRAASGLSGYLLEYLPSFAFATLWLVWSRLRGRIDVIHGCNPPDLFWILGLLGRAWGSKYVFDQHDANPELAITKWGRGGLFARFLVRLTYWLESRSFATASLVLAPNESYRNLALRRGALEGDQVVIVRNAPDVSRYQAYAKGIEPDRHRVGWVGVMGSQDGLPILVEAWRLVLEEPDLGDAHLDLVGDGEARRHLEDEVDRLNVRGSVSFHGYLQPETFVPILSRCSICVAPDPPNPFNDISTMVKVIDYLAIGRGIVSFDLSETRIAAGNAAYIVADATPRALADGLVQVLRDRERSRQLSAACRDRVNDLHLDWPYSAATLTNAYRRLGKPHVGQR